MLLDLSPRLFVLSSGVNLRLVSGGSDLRIAREMDGDQKSIRPIIRKLVAVALERFVLALPHPEPIVGLCAPVFQVLHHDFPSGTIALDAFE